MTVTVRYGHVRAYAVQFGSIARPYIPVRLHHRGRHFDTFGLIDSGADTTMFHEDVAQVFGLTLDPTAAHRTGGVGGSAPIWYFDLHIGVLGKRIPARIGFSPGCPRQFGLLGRADFFEAFSVGFDQRNTNYLLHPLP